MKNILNFIQIPTLSRHLFNKEKFYINLMIKDKDTKLFITNNFLFQIPYKKDNIIENKYIVSNFILKGIYQNKSICIDEITHFNWNRNRTIDVRYDLCMKVNNSLVSKMLHYEYFNYNLQFTNNLWSNMSENNYKIIRNIDNLIYKNKNNAN